jgi:hypothetical protein
MHEHTAGKRRPEILTILVVLLVLNAVVTGLHFILIFAGVLPADRSFAAEVASADIPVTVIPSLVAAYGLWRRRTWSWPLTLIVSGGYVHGILLLLGRSVIREQYGSMSFVALYFIVFTAILVGYLWSHRELFQREGAAA